MNDGGFQRCLAALAVPVVALVVRHVIVAAAVEYLPDCTTFFFGIMAYHRGPQASLDLTHVLCTTSPPM